MWYWQVYWLSECYGRYCWLNTSLCSLQKFSRENGKHVQKLLQCCKKRVQNIWLSQILINSMMKHCTCAAGNRPNQKHFWECQVMLIWFKNDFQCTGTLCELLDSVEHHENCMLHVCVCILHKILRSCNDLVWRASVGVTFQCKYIKIFGSQG